METQVYNQSNLQKLTKNETGATLLELLIATVIFSVFLEGLLVIHGARKRKFYEIIQSRNRQVEAIRLEKRRL